MYYRTVIRFVVPWPASEAKCSEIFTPKEASQSAVRRWDHVERLACRLDAWVTPAGLLLLQQPSLWRHSAAAHRRTTSGKGSEVLTQYAVPKLRLL